MQYLLWKKKLGKVLYEKNGYAPKYPASTTKIMTAILAIENCELDDRAIASEYAINSIPYDYAIANIQVGESVSIKDLLYVLMLHSANEAAYILAEHIGGSTQGFADMMNEKAAELGCTSTHFVNPNGIQDENHYSSAYDLALISRYAMQNETFRSIVSTTSYTMEGTDAYPYGTRTFNNTNHLIIPSTDSNPNRYYYNGATGIKTGYTSAAQNCLVSSAKIDGVEYISVVLGSPTLFEEGASQHYRYLDSIRLLNFAFDNYKFKEVATAEKLIESLDVQSLPEKIDVASSQDIKLLLDNEDYQKEYDPNFILNDDLEAPIKKGDVIGKIEYKVGEDTYTADLISLEDIDKPLLETITSTIEDYSSYYLVAAILLALGILGLIICLIVILVKSRRQSVPKKVVIEEDRIINTNLITSEENSIPQKEKKEEPKEESLGKIETDNLDKLSDKRQDNKGPNDDLSGELSSSLFRKR